MQKGPHDVPLLSELNDVFRFEGKHDDQLGDYVRKLWNACVEELEEVLKDVYVYECTWIGCGYLVLDRVLAAYGIKLLE